MDESTLKWLRETAAWPETPPHPEARFIKRANGGGLELVLRQIPKDRPFTVLEIGSEVGGSAREFLKVSEQVTVISVDRWPKNYWLPPHWHDLYPFVRSDVGIKGLFQKYCWEYRDRLFPIQGDSPARLVEAFEHGVRPDLLYIDGDHVHDGVFQDLACAHALWPNAIMTGDDWLYKPKHERYEGMELPVQYAVKRYALHRGYDIETVETTWQMHFDRKPSFAPPPSRSVAGLAEQIKRLDSRLLQLGESVDEAQKPKLSGFDRKLRKLRRDPVQFVLDTKIARRARTVLDR